MSSGRFFSSDHEAKLKIDFMLSTPSTGLESISRIQLYNVKNKSYFGVKHFC